MQKTPLQCQVTWLRKLIFYINLFNLTDLWCSKDHFSLKGIIIVDDAIQDDRHWSYSTTTIVADKAIKYKFFIFFLFYSLIFLQISLFTKMIPGNYDMPTKCLIADQICQCNKKKITVWTTTKNYHIWHGISTPSLMSSQGHTDKLSKQYVSNQLVFAHVIEWKTSMKFSKYFLMVI